MNPSMVLANMFNALIPIIFQIIPPLATLTWKSRGFDQSFSPCQKNLGYNLDTNINYILM